MTRRRDKLKADVRKYFDFKNIKSWDRYDKGLKLEKNWDDAIEEYRRQRSARSIQGAWRNLPRRIKPTDVVETKSERLYDPGDTKLEYSFDIRYITVSQIVDEVRRAFLAVPRAQLGNMYKVIALGNEVRDPFHTSYQPSKKMALEDFTDKLIDYSQRYENNFVINGVIISIYTANPENGAGGIGRSYTQANKVWKIVIPNTKKNCAYSACVVSMHRGEPRDLPEKARTLKARVNPIHKPFANDADLQLVANYKKTQIKKYNNVFELIRVFEPEGERDKPPCRKLNRKVIEIQKVPGHFNALLRRSEIGEPAPEIEPVVEPVGKHALIKCKRNRMRSEKDERIVAWDLECSGNRGYAPNIVREQPHICYASGFAWGNEYIDFWDSDCLKDSLDFLYDNREAFDGYTFYAHNGGKYDVLFLLKELFKQADDGRFNIPHPPTNQDGCYIHLKLYIGEHCSITFHDSLRIFGPDSSLESLCKDFDVEHKKLTETVSHDDITIDNWRDYRPQLKKYLEYDCKGLLEVMRDFTKQVYECSSTYQYKSVEDRVRQIFSSLYRCEFKTARSKKAPFMNGLELDGYNANEGVAFEVNGPQHDEYMKHFFSSVDDFYKYQENDRLKIKYCKSNRVSLFVIPWSVVKTLGYGRKGFHKALTMYISAMTDRPFRYEKFSRGERKGISLNSCVTGANLSKKVFFTNYYSERYYPIYTLNADTEQFIRDYYRGGRVEIFYQGKVTEESKFYYYDFTSLYPWAGTLDLPYGLPEKLSKDEIDLDSFFGFVEVKVKSKIDMLHKKPLHALYDGGKLMFRHFSEPTTIVLFSEELKHGVKSGMYEYEIVRGEKFKRAPFMKRFFEDGFKRKADAKKAKNPTKKATWKIILNSGYGFWGLRTKDRDAVLIQPKNETSIYPYLNSGKLISYGQSENGKYSIIRALEDLSTTDYNVAIASAISSYSRCRLWQLIDDVESKGKKVYMCDTDSVITNIKLNDYPDLMATYMWDGCGDDLGSLKNEADDHLKDGGWSKDDIKRLKEENGGMIHFDGLILGGCKFYSLHLEGCKDIAKCKGYKQGKDGSDLTFKDFEKMAGGTPQEQKQIQFRCPKQNHVSDDEQFAIRTMMVKKEFKFTYNKGLIDQDTGIITPYLHPPSYYEGLRKVPPFPPM